MRKSKLKKMVYDDIKGMCKVKRPDDLSKRLY